MASSFPVDADHLRDLNGLMAWLRTFPRMDGHGDECQDSAQLLQDLDVATAILFVADEICDEKVACASCKKDSDTIWGTIAELVASRMPQVRSRLSRVSVSEPDTRTFLLSALLCHAVSEHCPHRHMYIERIMGLPSHYQQLLKILIENGQSEAPPTQSNTPMPARRETPKKSGLKRSIDKATSLNEQNPASSERPLKQPSSGDKSVGPVDRSWMGDAPSFGSHMVPGYTPDRRNGRLSVGSLFSPTTVDSSLENLVDELRKQNESLKQELKSCQKREADLGQKMEHAEVAFRKEMIKLESISLQREEDALETHQQQIAKLQEELGEIKKAQATDKRAKLELSMVRDEMDLLEHTKDKLAETEERLRIYRDRLEQIGDVKEALAREEEAHCASVEKCLRLENEIKTLQPLKRQLDDYKTRATEAEVKLAECQEELKRLSKLTGSLSSAQKEILEGARIHKEEADELRRRLVEEETPTEEGPSVGEGLSELNPVVMEEMSRLRNENVRLKAFAAKREDDSVQMLEERLDDSTRLSERFKEQYFSTKNELEASQAKLQESQVHVVELQFRLKDQETALAELEQDMNNCSDKLLSTQQDLVDTSNKLQESIKKEESLRNDVAQLTEKLGDAEQLASHRQEILDSTEAELKDTIESLQASQEREQHLLTEVSQWTERTNVAHAAFSDCKSQLVATKSNLDDTSASLDAALRREVALKDTVDELVKSMVGLEERFEAEARATEAALAAKDEELIETRKTIEDKAKKELDEANERMTILLEKERMERRQQIAMAAGSYAQLEKASAFARAQLTEQLQHELATAKKEYEEQLAKLKECHSTEIVSLKQDADDKQMEIISKGKAILKATKERAAEELASAIEQLQTTESKLDQLQNDHAAYEKKIKSKISSYKQKLIFASGRINELSQSNDNMEEKITELERERFKLREDNERFRRQLGGRFGADGKVQNQLEILQKEFNAILDENRALKKEAERSSQPHGIVLSSISESAEDDSVQRSYTRGGVSGSTLSQLRKEYEETIEMLTDEKRELVMRNSAAITDVQKAEQRAWESDKHVAKLKEQVTSLKLALQRLERDAEEFHDARADSFDDDTKENAQESSAIQAKQQHLSTNVEGPKENFLEEPLLDLGSSGIQVMPLSDTTQDNFEYDEDVPASRSSNAETGKPTINAYEFPSGYKLQAECAPSLMDYAIGSQVTTPDDAQPECKQS